MWITALIGGASAFVENTLGQIFKEKNDDGTFKGGPAFYINKTMKKPGLAYLFSLVVCIVYGFMFNAMQANTIASGFSNSFNSTAWIVGLCVVIISAFVIFGGLKRISDITSFLVPVMAVAYLALVIFILITNFAKVPHMFELIFEDAFNMRAGLGGLFGTAILNGVKRGLFSNEAGMGAVPNASSVADVSHPALATYYDYLKQLKSGKDPVFDPKNIKELSPYLDEITAWYVDENL